MFGSVPAYIQRQTVGRFLCLRYPRPDGGLFYILSLTDNSSAANDLTTVENRKRAISEPARRLCEIQLIWAPSPLPYLLLSLYSLIRIVCFLYRGKLKRRYQSAITRPRTPEKQKKYSNLGIGIGMYTWDVVRLFPL